MKVDINIVNAIDQYLAANNIPQRDFAKRLGVSEATMVKWRRQGNGITGMRWATLYKFIKQYLPQDRIFISSNGEEHYSSLNDGRGGSPYFEPKFVPAMVPLFSTGNIEQYNGMEMVQSVEQFACQQQLPRVEYRPKVSGCGGIFAYDLPKAAAGIPQGARLYISSEAKPKNGGITLAVSSADGRVALGIYTVTGNTFTFATQPQSITGKLQDARTVFSVLLPVIMYEVICY